MSLKTLFVVYDNGSYDHHFPMGIGSLAAVLKQDGHDLHFWHQDMHHWADDNLRIFLDENEFDVVVFSLIAGYYQYLKICQKLLINLKIDQNSNMYWEGMDLPLNQNFF